MVCSKVSIDRGLYHQAKKGLFLYDLDNILDMIYY